MKVVREYINEKFTEESDPVHDMGIGIELVIKQFCEENEPDDAHDKEAWLWICVKYQEKEYVKYLINAGWDINYADSAALSQAIVNDDYDMIKLLLDNGAKIKTGYFWNQIRKKHRESYEFIRNYKGVKRIRENINEKFAEKSDPVKDMGIGKINFKDEFHKQYFIPASALYEDWFDYVNQFKGKWIIGKFHLYEYRGDYSGKIVHAEVKFTQIDMNNEGVLDLKTSDNRTYCMLDDESYIIKEDK